MVDPRYDIEGKAHKLILAAKWALTRTMPCNINKDKLDPLEHPGIEDLIEFLEKFDIYRIPKERSAVQLEVDHFLKKDEPTIYLRHQNVVFALLHNWNPYQDLNSFVVLHVLYQTIPYWNMFLCGREHKEVRNIVEILEELTFKIQKYERLALKGAKGEG